jgi:hypothetical protein
MQKFGGLPEIPHPRVIDVLRTKFTGKQFSIGFIPGKAGDTTFEDWLIRGFWVSGVSDQISRMTNSLMGLRDQIKAVESDKFDTNMGVTFNVSKPQWDDALKRISDTFGPTAMKYMQNRLSQLDNLWVAQLSSGDLEFRPDVPFTLGAQKHASKVFGRWNWSDSDEALSLRLFDTLQETERADFVLACAGAAFLDKNRLSAGPEVSTTLNTCRQSGVGAVPGSKTMVFVEFVGPAGARLPVPCEQIKTTASSPSGYKEDRSPIAPIIGGESTPCELIMSVPADEKITFSATAPGLIGRPAMSAPEEHADAKPPLVGWSNPTMFHLKDHDPAARWRIVEMQPSTNAGQ